MSHHRLDPMQQPDDHDARTIETEGMPPVDATALDVVALNASGEAPPTATVTLTAHRAGDTPTADTPERARVEIPIGTVLDDRYRLLEQVGSGGGGLVFRGVDLQQSSPVAIKLLRPDRVADERARMRFRREFRAIARLDHPHCLRVRSEGRAGPYLFMVMDYVGGGDLGRLTGAPVERLLPILLKLADALDYVHGQRIVHRDLKPGNVLLTDSDPPEPKLADFGIAAMQSEAGVEITLQGDGRASTQGTVDYMSPEQVRGDPADPRSDLYAFGCLIFRLLAGRPPFEGSSYNRLVARLLHPAPDLMTLCDVDPALAGMVARLLQTDPDARYQSALDLARDLAELTPDVAVPLDGARGVAYLFDAGLVGRDAMLSAIVERTRATIADLSAPSLVALVAPAGVGKTRLMQASLQAFPGRRVTVRIDASGGRPFAPLPALEAAFVDADDDQEPFDAVPGTARPGAEPWTAGLRARVNRLAGAMSRAAAEADTVVMIDDLHLAEPGGLTLLADVLDRLADGPTRPAMLATVRPIGADALDRMARRVPIHRLHLEPLDAADTARMVARMLGASVEVMPAALAPFVHRTSQGNPLLISADVQMLAESGALTRSLGGWVFDPPGREADVLATDLLKARLDRLAEATRHVLAHAAVCGDHFDSALLTSAFDFGEGRVLDAIDEGLRARILLPAEGGTGALDRYTFAHGRLTEVLYDGVEPTLRRRGHRAIAEQLAERGETSPAVLAHHYARSDDRAAACGALMRAGEAALAAYAFETATRCFEQVIERLDALPEAQRPTRRAACEERLAVAHNALGRTAQAVTLLERLTQDLDQPPLDRARRLRQLGMARLRTPDCGAGIGALEQALTVLGDRRPRTRLGVIYRLLREGLGALALRWWPRHVTDDRIRERAICHRELGFMYRWVDSERGGAHLAQSIRLATLLGDGELLIDGYSHAAMGFAFVGLPGPAERFEERARRMAIAMRDRFGEARVEVLSGALDTMVVGDEAAARRHFERAMHIAEQVGDRFLTDFVYAAKGWCMGLMGHFDEGAADFAAAHASAEALGADWLRADANAGAMMLDIACGRLDDALRRARGLAAPEIAVPMPALGALGTEGLGAVAFQQGRFRAAIAFYEHARRQYVEHHLERGWGYLVELEHFEALLCLVDIEGGDAVPDLIRRLRRLARQATNKLARMQPYAGCREILRGTIAARLGREARARALFERGLARRTAPAAYFDTWLRVRSTIERMRLGDPPAVITAEFDAIAALYTSLGAHGMNTWLTHMRRHYRM